MVNGLIGFARLSQEENPSDKGHPQGTEGHAQRGDRIHSFCHRRGQVFRVDRPGAEGDRHRPA